MIAAGGARVRRAGRGRDGWCDVTANKDNYDSMNYDAKQSNNTPSSWVGSYGTMILREKIILYNSII